LAPSTQPVADGAEAGSGQSHANLEAKAPSGAIWSIGPAPLIEAVGAQAFLPDRELPGYCQGERD